MSGSFSTNALGVLDLTGVTDGDYTASYSLSKTGSDYAVTEKTLTMTDIQLMLNYIVGKATPNSNQIISGNMNQDINFNMVDVQLALNTLVGKIDATVALRNEQATDATFNQSGGTIGNYSNAFTIQAGNAMNLEAFYLGDINGSFSSEILSD